MKSNLTLSKITVNTIKFIVGGIFIFSGIIKLNDPSGLGFKLEEYFSSDVLNMPYLIPFSYYIGLVVIIVEILAGIVLILGYKTKTTLYTLLFLTISFGFLTFYSAYFNKVTDCGCFGDAIKIDPWQSFYKNILFLASILFLIIKRRGIIKHVYSDKINNYIIFLSLTSCLFIARYVSIYLPFIDFRPYTIGTSIREGMNIPENSPKDVYENIWIYKVDGVKKEFKTEEEPWKIPNSEFVDRITKLIKKGYEPPIHDFVIEENSGDTPDDITDSILSLDRVYIVLSHDLDRASIKGFSEINDWYIKNQKSKNVILITSSTKDALKEQMKRLKIQYPVYTMDNTTIKTIVRSNPGVIVLEGDVIIDKKSWKNINNIK